MKIRLVRRGQKTSKNNYNIPVKPGKTLFDFCQNIQSAAYFAVNEMGLVNLRHNDIYSNANFVGHGFSLKKFDRKALRIK